MPTKAVRYTQPLLGVRAGSDYLVAVTEVDVDEVLIRQDGASCTVFGNNEKAPLANPVPLGVEPGDGGLSTRGELLVYFEAGRGYDAQITVGDVVVVVPLPDVSPDVDDAGGDTSALEATVEALGVDVGAKAPIASPAFTGTVTLPGFRLEPAGAAPFGAGVVGTLFNSTVDYVFDIGYNPRRVDVTEPSFTFTIESDYEPVPGTHALEAYFEYRSADEGTTFRPIFFFINRATHALTAVYKADTLQFQSAAGSNFMVAQPGTFTQAGYTGLDNVFRVGAAATRSSSFAMQQNAVDVLAIYANAAYLIQFDVGTGATLKNFCWMQTNGDVGVGTYFSIGTLDSKAVFTADCWNSNVNAKGIVTRGKVGQVGNLFEAQLSTGVAQWAITPAGLPKWAVAGLVQTTVGAAGGASALPATPTKYLKVVGDDGVTYVVPAYASA